MPSPGFEPAAPTFQLPQTYVLDRTATRIDNVTVAAVRFILTAILRV